jgi:hypothetical protein
VCITTAYCNIIHNISCSRSISRRCILILTENDHTSLVYTLPHIKYTTCNNFLWCEFNTLYHEVLGKVFTLVPCTCHGKGVYTHIGINCMRCTRNQHPTGLDVYMPVRTLLNLFCMLYVCYPTILWKGYSWLRLVYMMYTREYYYNIML